MFRQRQRPSTCSGASSCKSSDYYSPFSLISSSAANFSTEHHDDEEEEEDEEETDDEIERIERAAAKEEEASSMKAVMMKMPRRCLDRKVNADESPFVMVHLYLTRPALIARSRQKVANPTTLHDVWRSERDAFFHCDSRESTFEVRTFSRSGSRKAELVRTEDDDDEDTETDQYENVDDDDDDNDDDLWCRDSTLDIAEWDSGVHSQSSSRKSSSTVVHDVFKDRYNFLD